jgi:hypothetical protein
MLAPSNSDGALGLHADAPSALPFRWWMGIQRLATSHERSKSSITGKTVQLTLTAEHVCSFSLPKQHQFGKKIEHSDNIPQRVNTNLRKSGQ